MSAAEQAKKAVYYDQTVYMLREMIANEREWTIKPAATVPEYLVSDVLYQYAHIAAADAYQRAVRLSVLSDVLNAMTRNFRADEAAEQSA